MALVCWCTCNYMDREIIVGIIIVITLGTEYGINLELNEITDKFS